MGIAATSGIAIIMSSIAITVLVMCVLGGATLACLHKQKQQKRMQRLNLFRNKVNKVENLENVVHDDLEMLPKPDSRGDEPSSEVKLIAGKHLNSQEGLNEQQFLKSKSPAERMQFLKEIQS